VKSAWADQYDAITLEPTSARNFEMAALTSSESFNIVEYLMSLPDPTPAKVAAVRDSVAWFRKVEIHGYRWGRGNFMADRNSPQGRKLIPVKGAGPIWSRFYQINTDTPIFGDRDKIIHADVNNLTRERRNGYSWFNKGGIKVLAQYDSWARSHPKRPAHQILSPARQRELQPEREQGLPRGV
jgi:PelA/Pel-15E family pectate lyase